MGGEKKAGEPRQLAGSRSGDWVLQAGRAARHVHAVQVSDHSGNDEGAHGLRIRRRRTDYSSRPSRSVPCRCLYGTCGRALGRRYTPITRDAFRYEATIEDKNVFTRPWKISMPIYRRLAPNAQLMEFRCQEMAEETLLGHLRKNQLIKQWEGRTMRVEVTRKVPPGNAVYERHFSGNPPTRQ